MPTPPTWPSVTDQLQASQVTPGSALEQLVHDNQDFSLLRPEEAHDNLRLPLWLRVYWRKAHPELQISNLDPHGAYPDVLFTIHARMLANHDLPDFAQRATGQGGQP